MNALVKAAKAKAPVTFEAFDGVRYRGNLVDFKRGIVCLNYQKDGKTLVAYLERKAWHRVKLEDGGPQEEWEAVECGPQLLIEVKGVRPIAAVFGLYERREEAKANAALICAALAMRQALERISANAAESPEWIRRTASEGLAKLKGRAE